MNLNFRDASRFGFGPTRFSLLPKILLVDDEPEILSATKQLLVWAGFAVTTVSSAEEAISKLKTEAFEIVVTDFRLGGKQGDVVVLAARNTCPATPVVLVTGMIDDLPDWMRSGHKALPVVPKPFRFTELLAAMKHARTEVDAPFAMPG